MVELCMLRESVWFDQRKFEEAESRYHEILAARHSGLRIEGKAVATSGSASSSGSSRIASQIQQAKERIRQSLETTPTAVSSADMDRRIARLEADNKQLKATLDSVLTRLSALEAEARGGKGPEDDSTAPTSKEDEDEDDFELFGSDDEEAAAEAEKLKQERLAKYEEKKKKKPGVVAKSSIILEVKPWDDETDVKEIEKLVRGITADGLVWGASKFVPVAYGIKKLQINCIVEDDKIGTDFLEESITAFDDLVQSVDVAAFNKI